MLLLIPTLPQAQTLQEASLPRHGTGTAALIPPGTQRGRFPLPCHLLEPSSLQQAPHQPTAFGHRPDRFKEELDLGQQLES